MHGARLSRKANIARSRLLLAKRMNGIGTGKPIWIRFSTGLEAAEHQPWGARLQADALCQYHVRHSSSSWRTIFSSLAFLAFSFSLMSSLASGVAFRINPLRS